MKKLVAVILSVGMLFSLAACGGGNNEPTSTDNQTEVQTEAEATPTEITKEAYASMTAEDLLKDIKDPKNVTAEEYMAVLETLKFVNITDSLKLEKNITDDALKIIKNNAEKVPALTSWVPILVKHEAPQVRARAYANAYPVYGSRPEFLAEVKELLKTETEPFVIYCALNGLSTRVKTDDDIKAYAEEMTQHENTTLAEYAKALLK